MTRLCVAFVAAFFLVVAGMSDSRADDDSDAITGVEDDLAEGVVYNSFPVPFPGSSPSLGYQATSTDEFGDHVSLAGTGRSLAAIFATLTSWTCENDPPGDPTGSSEPDEACMTTPGSSYTHPITLTLYEVDNSGGVPAVGPLIANETITATVPFRPSWDSVNCTADSETPSTNVPFGGKWFDPVLGRCVNGFNFVLTFDLSQLGICRDLSSQKNMNGSGGLRTSDR